MSLPDVILRILLAAAVLAVAPGVSTAATLTWWATGSAGAAGGGGTWNTTDLDWTSDGLTWSAWNNTTNAGDIAFFGGTAGTVTLTTGITTNGLSFGTTGYTVTGNTLTLQSISGTLPTLNAPSNVNATIASQIVANDELVKNGAGTITFNNQKTYTGTTTINAGVLDLTGGGGATGVIRGTATVNLGGELRLSTGDATGYNTGAASLTTINLVGGVLNVNTTGNQTLGSGTIVLTGGTVTGVAGSNIDFFNGGSTITSLASSTQSTISSVKVQIRQNPGLTITVADGAAATDLLISSVISTNGNATMPLIKAGGGTLQLTGANTFSGTTSVTGGRLLVSSGSLANTAAVTVTSGTAEFAGTNTFVGGHGVALSNTRVLTASGAGSTILFASTADMRIGNVTLNNGGTLTSNRALTGYDVLMGTVSSGTTTLSVTGNATATMNGSGGVHLQAVTNFDVADVTSSSAADLTVSLQLDNGGSQGGTGGVRKQGGGTMAISRQATYTGGTIIDAGVVDLTVAGGSGGVIRGTATVNAGATLRLSAGDVTGYGTGSDRLSVINLVGGTMNVNTASNQTLGNATINMTGGFITGLTTGNLDFFQGGSTLNTIASSTTSVISGVRLSPLRQGSTTFTVAAGTTPGGIDLDISSVVKSSGDPASAVLTKAGAGTMRLSGSNTYGGAGTTIRSGTLLVANASALSSSGTVTLGDASTGSANTTLLIDTTVAGAAVTLSRPIGIVNQGTGSAILGSGSGNNFAAFSGAVTLAKDVTLVGGNSLRTDFTGGISGTGNVTIDGPNRVAFITAANTYSGSTTITTGGRLQLGDGSTTVTSFLPDATVLTADGTLLFAKGNAAETIGGLAGSGLVQVQSQVTNTATLVISNTLTLTFSGTIADGGQAGSSMALTKAGAGTQMLTGSNTYTGATTITDGTLEVGGSGVLGGGFYAGAILNNATLAISTSANQILSGNASGSGNLVKSGAGTLTLSGSNSFSGGSTLSGGVVSLANADAFGTTGMIAFTGGTLQFTSSNTVDYSGRFSTAAGQPYAIDTNGQSVTLATALTSDGATLTKLGSGTLTLSGNNTYSGATTISAGVLRIGDGGGTGSIAGNIVNAGTVVFRRSGGLAVDGIISGSGGLIQQGPGTTTLSGVNTYSGVTTVTGGILAVSTDANLGTTPGSATSGRLVIDGGVLAFTSGFTLDSDRGIALGPTAGSGTGTIDVAAGQTIAYGGVIADNGGTGSLVKTGGGVFSLTGVATSSGDTSVNAGTLQLGAGSSLASPLVSVASGATLSGRGTVNSVTVSGGGILLPGLAGSGTLTTGSLSFTGGATVTMGVSGGLPTTLVNVLGDVTPSGGVGSVVFAFGGSLANIGTGTYSLLTYGGALSDSNAFGYSGTLGGRQTASISGTSVAGAVSLVIGNDFPIWTGTNGIGWFTSDNWELDSGDTPTNFQNNDTVVFNDLATSGTVQITGSNATPASTTFAGNTKAMTVEAVGGFGVSTGSLIKSGSALVTIANANTFDGGTTLSAGRLRVGDDGALGTGIINVTAITALSSIGGTGRTLANSLHLDADVTLGDATDSGALTFTGTVTFDGASRTITTPSSVTLSGLVTNGGLTKAGQGSLTITGSNNYANGTTLVAGSLQVGNNGALGSGLVTLNGGTLSSDSGNARTLTNALAIGGDVALGDTTNTGALALGSAGGIALGGAIRQVTTTSDVTFAGAVTNGGLTKAGPGTLTLAAANSHALGTTLAGGEIALGNIAGLGTGTAAYAGGGTIRPTVGGTIANAFAINAGVSGTFDSADLATTLSGGVATAGIFTLTTTATQTLSGVISGTGAIVKAGAGRTLLTGTSTLTGDTTIVAGTLDIGGAGRLGGGSYSGAIANAGAIAVSTAADQTLAGAVSGIGSLTKTGAGTLTLSNATNSFSGGSTVTGGVLSFVSGGLGSSGTVTVGGGTLHWATGNTEDISPRLALVNATTATLDTGGNDVTLAAGFGGGTGGSLTKVGVGTLTLTGTTTYTGDTTISAGVLQVGGTGRLGGGSYSGAIANFGTLALATAANQTLSGSISGAGAITQVGPGTLTLTGNNSFSGQLAVSAGTLTVATVNNASANGPLGNSASAVVLGSNNNRGTLAYTGVTGTGSKAFSLATGGTGAFDVPGGVTLALSGGISGSGGLVKDGPGTLAFNTQKTYTGTTTVNGGVLALTGGGASEGTIRGVVNVNPGATLRLAANDVTGFGTTNQITAINVTSGTLDVTTTGGAGQNQTLGNCVITLTAGTITGLTGTTTNMDFFQGSSALTTLASSATSTVTNVFLTIRQTPGLTITVADGAADTDLLVASAIRNDASYTTAPLVKAGAGTLTLTAVNLLNAAAPTNINAGTLKITGTGQLYGAAFANTAVVTINTAATLEVDSFVYGAAGSLGQLRDWGNARLLRGGTISVVGTTQSSGNNFFVADGFSGGFTMTQAGQTLTLSGNGNTNIAIGGPLTFGGAGNITVNEVIENNTGAGSIIKFGAGTLTVNAVNTYSGSTTINSGTFILGGSGQLGGGNYAGAVTNNAAFLITSSADQTFSGVVGGVGSFTKTGTGTLALTNGANSFTSGITVSAGMLAFAAGGLGTTGTVSMLGGALRWDGGNTDDISSRLALANSSTTTLDVGANDVTLAAPFGNASSATVMKAGAGALALTAANDYTGGTQVNEGRVVFASGGLGGSGTVSLAAGTVLEWATGNAEDISSRLVLPASGGVTLDVGSNNVSLTSGLGAGSAATLTKAGAGTLTLTGSSGYTGGTTIATGTLALVGTGRISGSAAMDLTGPSAVLDISGANGSRTVGDLAGAAGSRILLGGNSFTAGGPGTTIFEGVISGSGGFTKANADGALTLTSIQQFTGPATIAAGNLAVTGANLLQTAARIDVLLDGGLLAPAGLEIVGGQTLGGYGTVFGDVTFAPGGIVSPGGSTGTLPISGAVTWSGSSAYVFEMTNAVSGTAGTGWDLLTASGLTITATSSDPFRILLTSLTNGGDGVPGAMTGGNWDADASEAWLFVDTDTTIDPFDPSWFAFDYANFLNSRNGQFSVARGDVISGGDATQLYVVYAAVPEPGTLCLAAAGLAAVAAWKRGRRRRPAPWWPVPGPANPPRPDLAIPKSAPR